VKVIGVDARAEDAVRAVKEKLGTLTSDQRKNSVIVFVGEPAKYDAAHRWAKAQGAATAQVLPIEAFAPGQDPRIPRSDFVYVERSGLVEKLGETFRALTALK
jgi:hypothetical protein